jgi:D-ribose pyranase
MKRGGVLNAQLAGALAWLGRTNTLMVCDAALPIPPGPEVVDLAFRFGVPSFETVVSGILEELVVEGASTAEEMETQNPRSYELLRSRLPDLEVVPHEELKYMDAGAKLVVRTGEATPYSNVIFRCALPF